MTLEDLKVKYDKLQKKYGAKELDSIYNGGCTENPDICFVFMNPTVRNIASSKEWKGIKSPWIGTKNIWDLFYSLNLMDENIYNKIKSIKGNASYKDSVKNSKNPSSMSKNPFLRISGFFIHKGFGIIFIYAQSQCGERIGDQIHPEDMTGLQRRRKP